MRAIFYWLVVLATSSILANRVCAQENATPSHDLGVKVTAIRHEAHEDVLEISVENTSHHALYLAQSPAWPHWHYRPRLLTLDVDQWSDGKTNLLPKGRSLSSSRPPQAGYFSVGPCRDVPFDNHWIRLAPGQTVNDEISAYDPSDSGYIPTSCTWRAAHLAATVRLTISASTSRGRYVRRQVTAFQMVALGK